MGAIVAASGATAAASATGHPNPAAFLDGFHHALTTAAVIAFVGAVIAALTLSGRTRHAEPTTEQIFAEAA